MLGLYTLFTGRSSKWPKARDVWLQLHPDCVVCQQQADTVHHVTPYAVDPSRELDPTNFASVCDKCHFTVGHLNRWTRWATNFWSVVASIRVAEIDRE